MEVKTFKSFGRRVPLKNHCEIAQMNVFAIYFKLFLLFFSPAAACFAFAHTHCESTQNQNKEEKMGKSHRLKKYVQNRVRKRNGENGEAT